MLARKGTLQGINISSLKVAGKTIFLFHKWDMLVPVVSNTYTPDNQHGGPQNGNVAKAHHFGTLQLLVFGSVFDLFPRGSYWDVHAT